jgi:twinkle protein
VILATDADAPGRELADELARRIGYAKCQRVTWPDGCKDANEVLVKLGRTALLQALADAQPYPVEGIVQPCGSWPGHWMTCTSAGSTSGCGAGWETVRRPLPSQGPDLLCIVTGSPGSGKSVFLDNLMVRLAQHHGWTFGICSPENQPLERHLAGILLGVRRPCRSTTGRSPRMTHERMREARDAGPSGISRSCCRTSRRSRTSLSGRMCWSIAWASAAW